LCGQGFGKFAFLITVRRAYKAPEWLKADATTISVTVNALPTDEKYFDKSIDMRKVIGFYSR
jgi:hypothetical protein